MKFVPILVVSIALALVSFLGCSFPAKDNEKYAITSSPRLSQKKEINFLDPVLADLIPDGPLVSKPNVK